MLRSIDALNSLTLTGTATDDGLPIGSTFSDPGVYTLRLTAYDGADHYDEAYFADLSARYRNRNRFARQRIANVFSMLPNLTGKRLFDVGCGMGTFTLEAATRGANAVGLDLAAAGIAALAAVVGVLFHRCLAAVGVVAVAVAGE